MLCQPLNATAVTRATLPGRPCCCPLPKRKTATLCRFQPGGKDSAADTPNLSDPMKSRRLINQLLQIQSLQSVDLSVAEEQELSSHAQQATGLQHQELKADQQLVGSSAAQQARAVSLFDDPATEDYDPLVLDML